MKHRGVKGRGDSERPSPLPLTCPSDDLGRALHSPAPLSPQKITPDSLRFFEGLVLLLHKLEEE